MNNQELEKLLVELNEKIRSLYYGKYKGIVKDIGDGQNLGYLKVDIPQVYGENLSPWVQPHIPFAGPNHGWLMLPEIGDMVWIEFEAGDISHPIWTGFLWSNSKEIPDPAGKETRVLVTPRGHKIILDDEKNEFHLVHSGGPEIKLTSDEISIKNGSSQIVVSAFEVNVNNGALVVK